MKKVWIVAIVMLILFGYLSAVGNMSAYAKGYELRNLSINTRGEVPSSSLTFSSYNQLKDFYENTQFGEGDEENGQWVIKGTIDSSEIHFVENGKEYFLIFPYLYQSNGKTNAISSESVITIENIPSNVVIVISGLNGATLNVKNFEGSLVIGVFIDVDVHSESGWWIFEYGFNYGVGFSGMLDSTISLEDVHDVFITDYVCDVSMSSPIKAKHVDDLKLSGVSIASFDNSPYTTGIRAEYVKNFTIENNAGLWIGSNGKSISDIFGLEIKGYYVGMVLEHIGNFTVAGTVYIGGWDSGKGKRSAAIIAYDVNNTNYNSTRMYSRKAYGDLLLDYYLSYNKTKTWEEENGTINESTINVTQTVHGNFYGAMALLYNNYLNYKFIFKKINLPINAFYYEAENMFGREKWWGIDVANFSWWGDINHTDAFHWCFGILQAPGTLSSSHDFTIYENDTNGEHIYLTLYSLGVCEITKHLENVENVTLLVNTTTESNGTVIEKYMHIYNYTWYGVLKLYGNLDVYVSDTAYVAMDHLIYGLGVEDNGTAEKSLISFVNKDVDMHDVDNPVATHINAPKEYSGVFVGGAFAMFAGLFTFLIAFAFVRWAYITIKAPEQTPEEMARRKEMLRNILIGTIIIVFVLIDYAVLLNLIKWGG